MDGSIFGMLTAKLAYIKVSVWFGVLQRLVAEERELQLATRTISMPFFHRDTRPQSIKYTVHDEDGAVATHAWLRLFEPLQGDFSDPYSKG